MNNTETDYLKINYRNEYFLLRSENTRLKKIIEELLYTAYIKRLDVDRDLMQENENLQRLVAELQKELKKDD